MTNIATAGSTTGVKCQYHPEPANAELLNRALAFIKSVPYRVTLRWVEYRLLQDGIFSSKDDFVKFKGLSATARKRFWGDWRPYTLADDTRKSLVRGSGYLTVEEWVHAVATQGVQCDLDFWTDQPYYVEIWFEARAMQGQFEHYTQNITLRPFGGDPGPDYKWNIAKALEKAACRYPNSEIVILYFGDYDPKGLQIPKSAVRTIREWCKTDFQFKRVGLNAEHPALYVIPENIEAPGCYQWEALDDVGARDLIGKAVSEWVDITRINATKAREKEAYERMRTMLRKFEKQWKRSA
jgi:hypothetical protein